MIQIVGIFGDLFDAQGMADLHIDYDQMDKFYKAYTKE